MSIRPRDDLAFIQTPESWPMGNLLPLKRPPKQPGAWPEFAILLANSNTILHTGIFELAEMTAKEREAVPKTEYASPEEIIEDGWLVD